jgi:hypothetical protein
LSLNGILGNNFFFRFFEDRNLYFLINAPCFLFKVNYSQNLKK